MLSASVYLLMLNPQSTWAVYLINIKTHIFPKLLQFLLLCKNGFKRQSNLSLFKLKDVNSSLFLKALVEGSHWIEAFHCQIQCQGSFNWNNLSHSFSNFEPDILYVISFFVKRQNISNERIVEWTFFLNLVQWEKLWSFSWAFPVYFHYNWL